MLDKDLYQILPSPFNEAPESEEWEFTPGTLVHAKESKLSDGVFIVPFKKATGPNRY